MLAGEGEAGGVEGQAEFLEGFADGAGFWRLIALAPSTGKIPVAGKGNAGLFIAQVDQQRIAPDQRQLRTAIGP